MLPDLYLISYVLCFTGLVFWYLFSENKFLSRLMQTTFLFGLIGYGVAFYLSDCGLEHKVLLLIRDLFILGISGYLFGKLANNKLVFITFLILFYAAFHLKLASMLKDSFIQMTAIEKEEVNTNLQIADKGEILLLLKKPYTIGDLQKELQVENFELAFKPQSKDITQLDDFLIIDIKNNQDAPKILNELNRSPLVEWAELNEVYQLSPLELIPQKSPVLDIKKFGLNDPSLKHLWGFQAMQIDQLYSFIKNNKIKAKKTARIFILDTGVDAQHEDLADNYISLNKKYDKDPMGHGTHCAGIAAAVSNNKKGVASFSQGNDFVKVTSISVLASHGGGTQAGIIKGMIEAADNGADIISMSLGGRSDNRRQKAYQKAVEYCNDKGAIVVVAAGNSNADARKFCPANAPGAITVAAVDTFLHRASFSNYIQNVDYGIAAPGVKIFSTIPKDKYASFNGTSMATPYVAGLLGLMKSIKPDLTTEQAYSILSSTGTKTKNAKATGPLIQPAKAIKKLIAK